MRARQSAFFTQLLGVPTIDKLVVIGVLHQTFVLSTSGQSIYNSPPLIHGKLFEDEACRLHKNEDKEVTCVDLFEINLEDIEELENMELSTKEAGTGFVCYFG